MNKRISRYNKLGRRPQPNLQASSALRPYESMEMKKRSFSMLFSFLLVWIVLTASAQAGQVVTDEVRLWAKGAIAQEKALETISASNTVAVLYFHNKTGWSDLDLLQKGLTLMLITDLSKVKEIQLVERVKIQALAEELGIGVSGLIASTTAPKVGKLLGVEHVIGGDILKGMIDDFQLKSNMLNVPVGEIYGQVSTEGKLLAELFRMEKDLLFEIIKRLKIELTPALELELKKPLTTSIDAFRRLLQGLEESDRDKHPIAAVYYQDALKEDPNFTLAKDLLQELKDFQLWTGRIEDDSEVEAYTALVDYIPELTPNYRSELRELTEREDIRNLAEIDIDQYFKGDPPYPVVDIYSLKAARTRVITDGSLRANVYEEKFVPGDFRVPPDSSNEWGYEWSVDPEEPYYDAGLQTLGVIEVDEQQKLEVLLTQDNQEWIKRDPFLAYAVQVEEDCLNRKILEMYQGADKKGLISTLMDNINTARGYAEIRDLDDWYTQKADAQAGRVLKDRNGWVRVQQYILRPDNNTTVQVLNVCLRGTGARTRSSTFEWTTTFTENYTGDLRELPWDFWLYSVEGGVYNDSHVELDNMYVKFTNPANDSFKEQRGFASRRLESNWQTINSEQLTLISSGRSETYGYDTHRNPIGGGFYHVEQGKSDGEFNYVFPSQSENPQRINISCYIVGDIKEVDYTPREEDDTVQNVSLDGIDDIWSALGVNESKIGEGPYIGNNNLEICIDKDTIFFSTPIDVVYIPMSRMVWKSKA